MVTEPCSRCKGTGCVTETSIACRGCCPDCQPPVKGIDNNWLQEARDKHSK